MNTFGQPYVEGVSQAVGPFPLWDRRSVRDDRQRFGRSPVPLLDRANSIYIPTGRSPTRAWILVRRGDYDKLDKYSTSLQLEVADSTKADNIGVLRHLSIVQAQCVTRGLAQEPDALYLVELTDARGVMHNRWFQHPMDDQYNIRAPAYPNGTFFSESLDSGVVWTWEAMARDMWERMPLLGPWPGFPLGYAQTGTPEGFWFSGVPTWYALCDVLEHIGLTVACDLTSSTPFTIVQPGADDDFDDMTTEYAGRLEDDLEWIDVGAGRVPGTVKVYFRVRNEFYGTEETVRSDDLQWATGAVHTVSVAAPVVFNGAVGTHYLWSDFTLRCDVDGVLLPADVVTADTIASADVQDYFAEIYRTTLGHMTRVYAGALPFTTGPRVDGVCYYQDYRCDYRGGWCTKLMRGKITPFAEVE